MTTRRRDPGTPGLDDLVNELAALRAKGLHRAPEVDIPALRTCLADITRHPADGLRVHHYEDGLRAGIGEMGEGHAAECAAILFGIDPHVRGLHPIELRKRAAELYYDRTADRLTVDAFRKTRERRILASLGSALLRRAEAGVVADRGAPVRRLPADEGDASLQEGRLVVETGEWRPRVLPVLVVEPEVPGRIRELSWSQFGQGIDLIRSQIRDYGTSLDIDMAIGVNEAGLLMATLLASACFSRCAIGYVRTVSKGRSLGIDEDHSRLGRHLSTASAVMICDFEVKTAPVLGQVCDYLLGAGLGADVPRYFATMGALAARGPALGSAPGGGFQLHGLACHPVLEGAGLADVFVGCVMASPGIDPPLGLR